MGAAEEEEDTLGAIEAYWRFGDSCALAKRGLNKGTNMYIIKIKLINRVCDVLLSDSSKDLCCFCENVPIGSWGVIAKGNFLLKLTLCQHNGKIA